MQKLKFTFLLALLLVGIVAGFFLRNAFKKKGYHPIAASSIFKKIEHVKQLRLVSYYSEELVVLGEQREFLTELAEKKETVNRLNSEISTLQQQITLTEQGLEQLKVLDGTFVSQLPELNAELIYRSTMLNVVSGLNVKNFTQQQADSLSNWYEADILANLKLGQLLALKDSLAKNQQDRDDRTITRKVYKDRKSAINELLEPFDQGLKAFADAKSQTLEDKIKSLKQSITKTEKRERKTAKIRSDNLAEYRKRLSELKDELWQSSFKLEEATRDLSIAEQELADAQSDPLTGKAAGLDPKILMTLPAELYVYMDLTQIQINEDSLESKILYVQLPEIEADSVFLDVASSRVDALDNSTFTTKGQRAYHMLLEQLKLALLNKSQKVRQEAIDAGVLSEAQFMAENYVGKFFGSMGVEVRFEQLVPEADSVSTGDSTLAAIPMLHPEKASVEELDFLPLELAMMIAQP
ncbi:DUF4230 domain-containing protein [Pontibacter sp. G13]|uniref:DUF4230 domain-containing protein n=1 Tax=Pontibacter sp. G13 TaxID=3074898 RepID=UPI00288C3C3B|nr:DUF4230 domain-containing protein [Pontibacter sp. G13]WNJ17333.1 DUF4230 domain-containing protein [Pontibacter sp. G13]